MKIELKYAGRMRVNICLYAHAPLNNLQFQIYCHFITIYKILKMTYNFRTFFIWFLKNLGTDGASKAPKPKPLIKASPKKLQQVQLQQQPLQMQSNELDTNAIKEQPIEDSAVQKQGRGNCYTEPMHHNCVTSELYLIT